MVGVFIPVIDAAREVVAQLMDNQAERTGRVTLAITAAIGQYLVAPSLRPMLNKYPGLKAELRLTERRVNIVSEDIVLAIAWVTLWIATLSRANLP